MGGGRWTVDGGRESRPRSLTILDRVPERGGVLLGQTHDLLCVAVSDKVGLVCSEDGPGQPVAALGYPVSRRNEPISRYGKRAKKRVLHGGESVARSGLTSFTQLR